MGCGASQSQVAPEGEGEKPRGDFKAYRGKGGGQGTAMGRSMLRVPAHLMSKATGPDSPFSRVSRRFSSAASKKSKVTGEPSEPPSKDNTFKISDLTPDQQMTVKLAFARFDRDESGRIGVGEMREAFQLLNQNPTAGEMDRLIHELDKDKDGFIDFLEFAEIWYKRSCTDMEAEFDAELELAFRCLDFDGDGQLSMEDLRTVLMQCGDDPMSADDVDEFIQHADKDNDGCARRRHAHPSPITPPPPCPLLTGRPLPRAAQVCVHV